MGKTNHPTTAVLYKACLESSYVTRPQNVVHLHPFQHTLADWGPDALSGWAEKEVAEYFAGVQEGLANASQLVDQDGRTEFHSAERVGRLLFPVCVFCLHDQFAFESLEPVRVRATPNMETTVISFEVDASLMHL